MIDESGHFAIALWLGTYLLHSTLLLGAAWLITKLLASGREPLKEVLWKCALIAPVISATLQVGLRIDPIAGGIAVSERVVAHGGAADAPEAGHPLTRQTGHDLDALTPVREEPTPAPLPHLDPAVEEGHADAPASGAAPDEGTGAEVGALPRAASAPSSFRSRLLGAWRHRHIALFVFVAAAMLALAAYSLMGWRRLRAMMRTRLPVTDGPPARSLERLIERCGTARRVRLSTSDRLAAPIAFGILRPEICLPQRVVREMSEAQQEVVMAHELAHLVRHDPTWMAAAHLLQRVFFFQPLNALAFRRLRELAELSCDAWAAELLGDRLTLARCLTEVAGWIVQGRTLPALEGVPGMAGSPSALRRRIRRLLEETPARKRRFGRRWLAVIVPVVIVLATFSAPGVSATSGRGGTPSSASDASIAEAVAPSPLDVMQIPALLGAELALLEEELARLRQTASRGPRDARVDELVDELQRRARELSARHDDVLERLSEILNETDGAAGSERRRRAAIDD